MSENKPRFIQESHGAVYFSATEQEALEIAELEWGYVTQESDMLWRIIPRGIPPYQVVRKIVEVLDRE